MAQHAFVAMPFGVKDGIDFNHIYADLIQPALAAAGFEAFRADEEMRAGEIRKDMFQELLLADLVLVDVSIDNPNVWYELGIRHALRARGVVVMGCREGRLPFDISTDRVLRYHRKDGVLDPVMRETDIKLLTQFVTETMESWQGLKVSPVYQTVPYLKEPDWKSLAVEGTEFWDAYKAWRQRVDVARQKNRPGDILVFAKETPTWVLKMEARRMAGSALMKLNHAEFALEQYQAALALDPSDLDSQQKIGVLLGRLHKHEEAREWVKTILEQHPRNVENWALLGRLEKEEWISRWRQPGMSVAEMAAAAASEGALLDEAASPYTEAFLTDPRHVYSGINAFALRHLQRHLKCETDNALKLSELEGGVQWACRAALKNSPKDYWARVSYADFNLFVYKKDKIVKEYKNAVAVADKDWFALDSSRQQLTLLRDLGFRPDEVTAALAVFDQELARLTPPWQPRRVFLFSGHMIDRLDRKEPRFPADKEPIAAAAIIQKLDELGASSEDLAMCGGACGGDLLFAEACLARGMRLHLHIQFYEPAFLEASVSFAGSNWRDRYFAVKANSLTSLRVMPEELGPVPKGFDPYTRNNLWQLYTALSYGPEEVRFISLWNGKKGDGPGGTKHMVETVAKHSGQVHILNTTALWQVDSSAAWATAAGGDRRRRNQ